MVARLGSAIAFAEGSDEQGGIAQEQADKLFLDPLTASCRFYWSEIGKWGLVRTQSRHQESSSELRDGIPQMLPSRASINADESPLRPFVPTRRISNVRWSGTPLDASYTIGPIGRIVAADALSHIQFLQRRKAQQS